MKEHVAGPHTSPPLNRMVIAVLALVGLFVALYLLAHNSGLTGPIVCGVGDCGTVQSSVYAKVESRPSANSVVKTPVFDRIADSGVLFKHAFVTAPSCTPCRSSLLSGQYFFRTGLGAILQGAKWDSAIPSFPLMLHDAGYHIGETYKVWTPGTPRDAPFGAGRFGFEKSGNRCNGFSQVTTKRVDGGMSVAAAKQLQGGGHPNACGATLPQSIQRIPDAVGYLKKTLNPKPGGDGLGNLGDALEGLEVK